MHCLDTALSLAVSRKEEMIADNNYICIFSSVYNMPLNLTFHLIIAKILVIFISPFCKTDSLSYVNCPGHIDFNMAEIRSVQLK